jgi:hypothetical protein
MTDVSFFLQRPWRSLRYAVARRAIMPLAARLATNKPKSLPEAIAMIQRRWRHRLFALRGTGWPRLESLLRTQYLRNCPPFGIDLEPNDRRPCRQFLLCPFCWARAYPLKAFARMEALLYDPEHPRRVRKDAPRCVTWFSVRVRRELPQSHDRRLDAIRKGAADLRRRLSQVRRDAAIFTKPPGNGVIVSARMEFDGDLLVLGHDRIVFSRQPVVGDPATKKKVVTKATKTKLVRLFARVFAYPKSMMTANAHDVVCLVEALKQFHMVSFAGSFDERVRLPE